MHLQNVPIILVTLLVFHFELSVNDDYDEHPSNIKLILVTLLIFHFEISGKDDNDSHPLNILLMLIIFIISLSFISNLFVFIIFLK